jgi:FKBP-type peptidyl-prolyl cis-trans isomerase FkpA
MKQTIFTLLLLSIIGLMSCRKASVSPDIKQYDSNQIQSYITANGLTDMTRDTSGGDTTGMYYKIILKGSGPALNYPDKVSLVFTLRSFDGKYISADTIVNHFDDYLGHIYSGRLPAGLQLALHNILKYRGGSMRLLIPSHLAYGTSGYGSGSTQNANTRIAGNQCLDYYVHVIGDQAAYDDLVIKNYMQANSLTGYTKTASGLYYLVRTPGTGTAGSITDNSTVTSTFTKLILNGTIVANGNTTGGVPIALTDYPLGVQEGLKSFATAGTLVNFIMPSRLADGEVASASIPANSCIRFDVQVVSVTP